MSRVIKVLLLTLFLGILVNRLYYLYYGRANVITTVFVFAFLFLLFDFTISRLIKSKWHKSNFRLTFWVLFIGILFLEFSLRFYLKQNVQASENTFFGSYYSPYRAILLENKLRRGNIKDIDVGIRLYPPNSERIEEGNEFRYVHSYNSYGFRSSHYEKDQIDTSTVMLALGDSFTEGIGTSQDSTWVQLLADKLKIINPSLISFNAGYRGSDLFYEYYKLNSLVKQIHPDLVILVINETEINDVLIRGGLERFIDKNKVKYNNPPWWEYIYSFSFCTRYIIHNIQHKNWHFYTNPQYSKKVNGIMTKICDCIVDDFYPLSIQSGFDFYVVYIPMQHEMELNWDAFTACQDKLNTKKINAVNLWPSFELVGDHVNSYYWPQNRHLNGKGYEYVANEIKKALAPLGYVTSDSTVAF